MSVRTYDVVVIGGGPAGSTASALLAMAGHRVAVVERQPFPRYHVGESLLPHCYYTLRRVGMVDKLRSSPFVRKHSVQFAALDGRVTQPFYFDQHMGDDPAGQTWQVERSEFDRMMLENAGEKGAEVLEGWEASELIRPDGGPVAGIVAKDRDGGRTELRAPMTIDCSGRDGFAINRLGWRKRDPFLSKVAMWTYYRGGKRGIGVDEGATTVVGMPERGWFWHIPLHGDRISLGLVAQHAYIYRDGKDPAAIFEREIRVNPWLADAMAGATQEGRFWVTGDYSYRSEHAATDGLVLAGDAFAFLDPVFSSGVFLAVKSGELVADATAAALVAGDPSAARFAPYADELCRSIEAMRRLVYAFYNPEFSFGRLLKNHPHLRDDVTDCLIGHLSRDYTELFDAVAELVDVPPPLEYGRPLVAVA